ncbi:MAG TPA: hypothetical protein DIU15_10100 [Deltaproteobacteria bacterium]|nr:hypothetical protein [Deltaproteobacteria bacterium]
MLSLSAQTCNACHGEVHDQWASSGHATAATNPVYLAATDALGNPPLCRECHLPLQNQRVSLARGPAFLGSTAQEANPDYEPSLALEGVTCAACHVRDGVILGPRTLPTEAAPHRVLQASEFRDVEACAFCHQLALPGAKEHPFIDTVGEWQRSPFSQAGISCQDCHMPRVSGIIAGSRYAAFASHLGLGGRSSESLRRAITLEVELSAASLERGGSIEASARLMNTGAGHAVPTGDPSHRLEVRFEVEGPGGKAAKGAEPESHWLAREVDTESPFTQRSDTRLQPMEVRSFDFKHTIPRNQDPGRFTLRVSVHWWAVSLEQAKATSLEQEDVHHVLVDQRIPFEVF